MLDKLPLHNMTNEEFLKIDKKKRYAYSLSRKKVCDTCGTEIRLSKFLDHNTSMLHNECKDCRKEAQKNLVQDVLTSLLSRDGLNYD